MYRPPSRPPRGAWARHLHEKRRERNLSQARAFELLYEGLGLSPRSRSAYLAIDMGDRQPTEREAAYLASVFGWPSVTSQEPTTATEGSDALVAALMRQATAIEALVDELRLSRAEQVAATAVAFETLGTLAAIRDRAGTQLDSDDGDPVGTPR